MFVTNRFATGVDNEIDMTKFDKELKEMLLMVKGKRDEDDDQITPSIQPPSEPTVDPFGVALKKLALSVAPGVSDACAATGGGRGLGPCLGGRQSPGRGNPISVSPESELPGSANLSVSPGHVGVATEPGKGYRLTFADMSIVLPDAAVSALKNFVDNSGESERQDISDERDIESVTPRNIDNIPGPQSPIEDMGYNPLDASNETYEDDEDDEDGVY